MYADTALGPQKLLFLQQHLGLTPQQVLAADRKCLQRSFDRLIRPRVLMMLHQEHTSCYDFPGAPPPPPPPFPQNPSYTRTRTEFWKTHYAFLRQI